MKNIENLRERRAVSPVIATVILVAVAITVAVGVSYWMSGIAGQYTSFEKVEITSGYATNIVDGWNITIKLKNTGSAPSTITSCFINEKPIEEYYLNNSTTTGAITMSPINGVTLESGTNSTIVVTIKEADVTFSSGTTINVKLHSAGGMDYIKLVRLS